MGEILLPEDQKAGAKPLASDEIMATVVFQDENYTIMRNKEKLTNEDMLNVPLHMMLLSMGMLSAQTYVPKVGKQNFTHTLKTLHSKFKKHVKDQLVIASRLPDSSQGKKHESLRDRI